jgi:hypothetical protein
MQQNQDNDYGKSTYYSPTHVTITLACFQWNNKCQCVANNIFYLKLFCNTEMILTFWKPYFSLRTTFYRNVWLFFSQNSRHISSILTFQQGALDHAFPTCDYGPGTIYCSQLRVIHQELMFQLSKR